MIILHIAWLDAMQASGVNVVVPDHVRYQRQYADTALWCVHDRPAVKDLKQVFTAKTLDELPAPYNRPDIAVFHETYIPAFFPIYRTMRKRGIPYVIVPHSELNKTAQEKSHWKKVIVNALCYRSICEHAAGIQCLTEHERENCIFGNHRFIAPNGIAPQPVTKTSFRQAETRFVYIGRLQTYMKGIDILVEAFAREKDFLTANHCHLDIYGPDDDRGEHYADAVRGLIHDNQADSLITLHDAVYGKEKEAVLLDSDIFIQTSRNEGMPMGILEALTYGLPCLVTMGSAMGRPVAHANAGWCAETDPEAVAKALVQAVKERDRLADKSRGALACAKTYEWNTVAKTAVEEYRRLCGKERDAG